MQETPKPRNPERMLCVLKMRCVNCGGGMEMHSFERSENGKTMEIRYVRPRCKHEEVKEEDAGE